MEPPVKISRVLAGTAGVALVGASALAFAAPASAADIVAPAAPFPAETSPYAAGWFTGGGSVGSSSNDAAYGLNIAAGPLVTDTYQVLNGTPVDGDLTDLVDNATIFVTRGVATFQIPVFGEPGATNQQFTTLRPAAPNTPGDFYLDSDAQWVTSQALPGYAAGATATLAEFEGVLDGGDVAGYQILAFGAAVGNGFSGSISEITFAGDTHLFRAAATGTQSATTVTRAQLANPGITFTVTGLVPEEPIVISGYSDFGGGIISEGEFFADATGTFVYTYAYNSAEFPAELGVSNIGIFGVNSGADVQFAFTVVADVAAVPAPATPAQLAATGTELSSGIIAGGILLLAGAGFALVATRRRLGNQA
jgi:LPXTG-motif cell wall-anchored protein